MKRTLSDETINEPPSRPVSRERSAEEYEQAAKQRLASQLATERVRHLEKKVQDPFDAWSEAREEILGTLESVHLRRAI